MNEIDPATAEAATLASLAAMAADEDDVFFADESRPADNDAMSSNAAETAFYAEMDAIQAAANARRVPTDTRLKMLAQGYHPVPVLKHDAKDKSPGKRPTMPKWQTICAVADEAEIRRWEKQRDCLNTGLLCGDVVGVDIDVPDEAVSLQVLALADAMLPATPLVRIGKAPKSLRVFRAEGIHNKVSTAELFLPNGTKVQVEALGAGNHFVSFGIHPDTKQPYTWPGKSPLDVPFTDLPVLPDAALRGFLGAAEAVMRAAGGKTEAEVKAAAKGEAEAKPEPPPKTEQKPQTDKEGYPAPTREDIQSALAAVPNAHDWQGWHKIGAALYDGLADDGEDLFMAWSAQSSKHDADATTAKWQSYRTSPTRVTVKTLFWQARRNGWKPAWQIERDQQKQQRKGRKVRDELDDDASPADGPTIRVIAGKVHITTTLAEDALLASGLPIYQRGDGLVQPVTREVPASRGRMTLAAGLGEMTVPSMVDVMCQTARYEKFDARAEDWIRINPPNQVAQIMLSRQGKWGFPAIAGIITTPTLRPDGTLLTEPGYDRATRLYHVADTSLRLHPEVHAPTRDTAERALKVLLDLLQEFSFVTTIGADKTPREVAKAVALSALITPTVRGAMPVAPLHAVNAHAPGSGKSFLIDLVSLITTGRPCPVITAAPDEAETEKRIAGLLLAGYPIVSIDNCNGELGGDLLCQAIERPLIRIRRLGASDIIEIESSATIYATGNNLRVRGDMVRRSLVAELDPQMERPELREFKHDPVALILADRGKYVSACIIIVRAYIIEKLPGRLPAIASFEGWSDLVRSALVWLGCADPALSMDAAREDDPELSELREMMGAWQSAFGSEAKTCKAAIAASTDKVAKADANGDVNQYAPQTEDKHPELQQMLQQVAGRGGIIDAARLGRWLLAKEGRIVGKSRFKRDGTTSGSARWKLETTK